MRSRVVAATLFAVAVAASGQDTVTLKDGSQKQGTVQEVDFRGVKLAISGGGGTTTLKRDDVTSIAYGGLAKDYKQAEEDVNRNKFEDAAPSFTTILENRKLRPPLRQNAWWHLVRASIGLNKPDDAVKNIKGLIEEFPQSEYLEQAHGAMVEVLVLTGKAADAVAFLEAEEARLGRVSETGSIIERMKLLKARAYLAANDTKKAKAEATAVAGGTSPSAADAKVLLGDIALADKNVAEAKKLYQDALKAVATRSGRAGAFNGLGGILLKEGEDSKKPDQIREALLLFLRTALVEIPMAGEPTEPHETGIYNSAKCFQYLGELGASSGSKAETKSEGRTDDAQARNLSRARELFKRLLREYPQTKYAQDAQLRLQKLGG